MPYKPLEVKTFKKYLKLVGWKLVKGGIDYKLHDENNQFVCSIKIAHGKNTKEEVVALSVKKTEQEFKIKGWTWPPKKK